MADEIEPGGAGPRIENAEDFAKWLEETRPSPDVCVALAARAALRALPFVIYYFSDQERTEDFEDQVSRLFRAAATSRIVAKFPKMVENYEAILSSESGINLASVYNASMVGRADKLLPGADSGIFWASAKAALAAISFQARSLVSSTQSAYDTREASFYAVDHAANGILSVITHYGRTDLLRAITKDSSSASTLEHLENITSKSFVASEKSAKKAIWGAIALDILLVSPEKSAQSLTDAALWHSVPYPYVLDSWRRLAINLPDLEGWWVWKNWYEDILKGKTHSEAHDVIYATVPIEEWDKGPAAANAWIAARLAELENKNSATDINLDDFPKPLDDVPSLFTFGLNTEGKIDIVAGPQNTPVIAFAGDEATHRQWLDTARELARRLAADLRAEKFGNIRRDYLESLVRYIDDLPIAVGEGNFLLADHEIITIHDLFQAEAAILPEGLAARLNRVLEAHYSLLDFYPETKRYHEAALKGRLAPPAPEEAFAGFTNVVREFTPEIFAPRVTQEIEAANFETPRVEVDEEDRKLHAVIVPAPYPMEQNSLDERIYGKASTCNAVLKAVNPEKINAYWDLAIKLKPFWDQIKPLLETILN